MSIQHKVLYANTAIVAIGLPILLVLFIVPFDFYVKVNEVTYHDVCVGMNIQDVTVQRDVKWADGYIGDVKGEVFKYDAYSKIETLIDRDRNFAYQVSSEPITYRVVWSKPFNEIGVYGASDLVTLHAPLFDKVHYFSEDDQKFNVIDC